MMNVKHSEHYCTLRVGASEFPSHTASKRQTGDLSSGLLGPRPVLFHFLCDTPITPTLPEGFCSQGQAYRLHRQNLRDRKAKRVRPPEYLK